jgi:hypothetical protein
VALRAEFPQAPIWKLALLLPPDAVQHIHFVAGLNFPLLGWLVDQQATFASGSS